MRGAPGIWQSDIDPRRIIPADAGSTPDAEVALVGDQDHPRGCGEHIADYSTPAPEKGSPPRMRGARIERIVGRPTLRIIPADAGSTTTQNNGTQNIEDHPRGCGEHP